jgi:hypothetical protein
MLRFIVVIITTIGVDGMFVTIIESIELIKAIVDELVTTMISYRLWKWKADNMDIASGITGYLYRWPVPCQKWYIAMTMMLDLHVYRTLFETGNSLVDGYELDCLCIPLTIVGWNYYNSLHHELGCLCIPLTIIE